MQLQDARDRATGIAALYLLKLKAYSAKVLSQVAARGFCLLHVGLRRQQTLMIRQIAVHHRDADCATKHGMFALTWGSCTWKRLP